MNQHARRIGTAYPGGVKQAITYFNSGQEKEIKTTQGSSTLSDLQYSFTETIAGIAVQTAQRQSVDDATSRNVTTSYQYDLQNRLTGATNVETSPTATTDYTYDYASRNRTKQTAGSDTTHYAYDDDNELCRSTTGSASGCDFASGDTTDYTYSVGFAITENLRDAIDLVRAKVWTPPLDADGGIREGGDVVELTGLIDPTCWRSGRTGCA